MLERDCYICNCNHCCAVYRKEGRLKLLCWCKRNRLREKQSYFLMFIGPCIIVIVEEWKTNFMSLAILFHFLCAQHVWDINISIIRILRLCCWITTSVVLFSVRCVLEIWCGSFCRLQPAKRGVHKTVTTASGTPPSNVAKLLLMMDVLMSETCWAHKKWNEIASDIELVFYSLTPGLNFTLEQEQGNRINSLDLTIMKDENKLTFDIFRKPTTTDVIIPHD